MASQNTMEIEQQLRLAGIDVALLRQMASQNNESNDYQLEDTQTTDFSGIHAPLPDVNDSPLNEASYSLEVESKSFDHEEFIDRLKELPCLWNTSISSYKDRIVKLNAWRKLAKLFDRDVDFLKNQLKNLKDSYKKCLDRQKKATKSGSGASKVPKCKYFDQLHFLYNSTANKQTESNITVTAGSTSYEGNEMLGSKRMLQDGNDEHLPSKLSKGRSDLSTSVDKMLIKTLGAMEEKEKVADSAVNEQKDSDYLFCNSLVPILRGLPQKKNRYAKMKIQQLLYEIEYEESN